MDNSGPRLEVMYIVGDREGSRSSPLDAGAIAVRAGRPLYTSFSQTLNGHAPHLRGRRDPPFHCI